MPFFARWFLVAVRCHNCGREHVCFAPLCSVKAKPGKRSGEPISGGEEMERIRLPRLGAGK